MNSIGKPVLFFELEIEWDVFFLKQHVCVMCVCVREAQCDVKQVCWCVDSNGLSGKEAVMSEVLE